MIFCGPLPGVFHSAQVRAVELRMETKSNQRILLVGGSFSPVKDSEVAYSVMTGQLPSANKSKPNRGAPSAINVSLKFFHGTFHPTQQSLVSGLRYLGRSNIESVTTGPVLSVG